jgi:hypothetical protein
MATPRRRIVRPSTPTTNTDAHRHRQLQKLRGRLDHDRKALGRWHSRLTRAFNTVQKLQAKVVRLERQMTKLEG